MSINVETRRDVGRERASKVSLGGDIAEDTPSTPIINQIAWLSARFNVGSAHARVLAEHCFAKGTPR